MQKSTGNLVFQIENSTKIPLKWYRTWKKKRFPKSLYTIKRASSSKARLHLQLIIDPPAPETLRKVTRRAEGLQPVALVVR